MNFLVRTSACVRQRGYHNESITNKLHRLFMKNKNNEKMQQRNPWPTYKFTESLQPCYPLSDMRCVPPHISRPDYADHCKGYPLSEMAVCKSDPVKILSEDDIANMKIACKLARECLDIGVKSISVGMTTDDIDKILHEAVIERNCYPSPLNYFNFPKSCCTSVNEVICHGIPDQRKLQNGDIINLDVTCYCNGFHGDVSETIFVGDVDEESKLLVQTAYNCLMTAIYEVRPGFHYSDIGKYIEKEATDNGFSVTKSYGGHGINQLFHTTPSVPHHANNRVGGIMKPGHVFTIEPMINQGVCVDKLWPDNWTVVTVDGKRSAQFEHTVLVTDTGVDILTKQAHSDRPYFMDQIDGGNL